MKKNLFILALLCAGYAVGSHDRVILPAIPNYQQIIGKPIPKNKLPWILESMRSFYSSIRLAVPDKHGRLKWFKIYPRKEFFAAILGLDANDSQFLNAWNHPDVRELAIAKKHGSLWLSDRIALLDRENSGMGTPSFSPVIEELQLYTIRELMLWPIYCYGVTEDPQKGTKRALTDNEIVKITGISLQKVQQIRNKIEELKKDELSYEEDLNITRCVEVFKHIVQKQIYDFIHGIRSQTISKSQTDILKKDNRALEMSIKMKDCFGKEHSIIHVVIPHWYAPRISAKNILLPFHQIVKDCDGKDWIFGYYGEPGEALSIKYYGLKMEQDDQNLYELSPAEQKLRKAIQAATTFVEMHTSDGGTIRLFPSSIAVQHNFSDKTTANHGNRFSNKKLINSGDFSQQNTGQKTDNPVSLSIIQPTPQSTINDRPSANNNNNGNDNNNNNGNNDDAVSKNPVDASHYYFAPATNENIADATQAKFTQGKLFSWEPREAPYAFNPNQSPLESRNIRQIDEFKTLPEYNEICKMQQNIFNCLMQKLDPAFWAMLDKQEHVKFTFYGVKQAIKEAWYPTQLILKQFNLPEEQNNFLQDTWNGSISYFRMPTHDSSCCHFDYTDLGYGKNTQKYYDVDTGKPRIIIKGFCPYDLIVSGLHELGHILQEFFWQEYAVIDPMQRDYDEDMSMLFEVAALNHLFKADENNDAYFLLQQRLWDLVTEYLAHTMVMRVATNQSIFRKDDEDYKRLLRLNVENGAKAEAEKIWNMCKMKNCPKELQAWKNIYDKINQIEDANDQKRACDYIINRAAEKFLCFFGCSGGRLPYDFPYGKGFVKAVRLLVEAKEPKQALKIYAQQNQTKEFFSSEYIHECCQQFSKNFDILFSKQNQKENFFF